jgi:hypothetical protein
VSQIQTKFVANNAVTNAKLAQAPADTLKGNNTAGTANVSDLTVTQVQTLLSIPTASSPLPIGSGGTGQTTANSAFNALAPSTAKGGLIVGSGTNTYANVSVGTDNALLTADSTSTDGAAFQRPSNLKNYISNPGFESNTTTNWSLGTVGTLTNGIPTGSPTFGSGASGNLSISTVSSGQLAGTYSLSYASSAATTSGNMLATAAMTIDTEDQAKVLTFKFYYSANSGASNGNFSGTSSNSFGIAVYDVTNSSWLSSTANFGMTQSSGVGYATGTCQTNATTTSLRFVMYNANATTGAITLYFDDFFLGPQTAPLGAVMTDWVAYTPTISAAFGTPTGVAFYSRRNGDSLEVLGSFTAGTIAASAPTITIGYNGANANVTFNSSKVNVSSLIGDAVCTGGASTTNFRLAILSPSANAGTAVQFGNGTSTAGAATVLTTDTPFATGATIQVHFTVPITGWSSNTQMSSDTDTRVVALHVHVTTPANAGTLTGGGSFTVVKYDTVDNDTHGAYSTSTGQYTVPVTGYYDVSACFQSSGTGALNSALQIDIFNATTTTELAYNQLVFAGAITDNIITSISAKAILLTAGTLLEIRSAFSNTYTGGAYSVAVGVEGFFFSLSRVSGPSVIAATESVNLSYTGYSSGITGTTNATVTYSTKIRDSHNGYAAGIYTVPVSGAYQVEAGLLLTTSGTPTVGTTIADLQIIQAGSASTTFENKYYVPTTNTTIAAAGFPLAASGVMSCLAGDTIKVQGSVNLATASGGTSSTMNYFGVVRVGN